MLRWELGFNEMYTVLYKWRPSEGGNNKDTLFRSFQCNELTGRALISRDHKNSDDGVPASQWAHSLCFSTRSLSHGVPQAPQPAASLNNAIPIPTPMLLSNSCLVVFLSPSLFRLCGKMKDVWDCLADSDLYAAYCLNIEGYCFLFWYHVTEGPWKYVMYNI